MVPYRPRYFQVPICRSNTDVTTYSEECMAAAEPIAGTPLPAPITLVRKDGRCIIPTGLMYEHPNHNPSANTSMAAPASINRPRTHFK